MRTIIALQKRLLYCLGDHLRDIHPVLDFGGTSPVAKRNLIYAREACQVLDLAGCASAQDGPWPYSQPKRQFFLVLEIAKENATSVQRHSRRWHLPHTKRVLIKHAPFKLLKIHLPSFTVFLLGSVLKSLPSTWSPFPPLQSRQRHTIVSFVFLDYFRCTVCYFRPGFPNLSMFGVVQPCKPITKVVFTTCSDIYYARLSRQQSRQMNGLFFTCYCHHHRKRKLYICLTPIAGGFRILYTDSENIETGCPTPIYIPLSEAQGRWPPYMVGRRTLQITILAMALSILPKILGTFENF